MAIAAAHELVDSGAFFETLARRIAVPTASSEATADVMHAYFDDQITPDLEALGYTVEVFPNPAPDGGLRRSSELRRGCPAVAAV